MAEKSKRDSKGGGSNNHHPFDEDQESLLEDVIPSSLPILPLRSDVPFPEIIMPLVIGRDRGILLIDDVLKGSRYVGLATQRDPDTEEPSARDLYPCLCIARVLKMLKFPDGSTRIVAQGLRRARLGKILSEDPYLVGEIDLIDDIQQDGVQTEALVLSVRRLFNQLIEGGAQVSEELQVAAMNTHAPGALADLMGSGLGLSTDEKQQLLSEPNVRHRLRHLGQLIRRQVDMQDLSSKIQGEVSTELTRVQREQFLRQQLQAIRRELGEADDEMSDVNEFYDKLETLDLPEQAAHEARRELDRMAQMHPSTPEYHVIRTFLDTLLSMPWDESTDDRLDLRRAKRVLDEDHYNLEKIKQRILEYLAVRKLKQSVKGPILCFVGPPGVGKTSLGKSVARTMNRKFYRLSLGGVHDEAEIRGHRRTYIGAMPGRIIQGLRRLGTNNPVFMLDEIDKLGADYRGDPSSALLEVLDPEQNGTFRDHYLDVEFDLSKVLFICTANVTSSIPPALLDRMEVIELSGYSLEEKLAIAHQYLVPKQLEEHGLKKEAIDFNDQGVRELIQSYTHEAGLRNLEREIASICRKVARSHVEGNRRKVLADRKKVQNLLGPPKYIREEAASQKIPGVATGLAWTAAGGELLTIESVKTPGKNTLKLTGQLGDVMKESAHASLGYLRCHSEAFGIPPSFFDDFEVHIHVPAGAIPKDGPSAGIALTASVLSLALNKPIRPKLAVTGEITLTGRVLPVGGIREKVLAAKREGFDTIVLPLLNEKDTADLPKEARDGLTFVYAKHIDAVVPHLFDDPPFKRRGSQVAKVVRNRPSGSRKATRQPAAPA
ncbi:Lon protease 2 [Planctomycetes bacterium Pan216]|uniref:Lon protease n=1 Tax=Kolteria novifilia TaxID=2527975 RepID=A0A518AYE0_9BACT|nr:Lon protease 2 [Planctomycetes bacterium Pan216]